MEAKSAAEAAAAAAEAAAAGKAAAAADLQELQEAYGELQQQHGHLTVSGAGGVLEHVCIVVPEKRYSTVQHSSVQCAAMQ
jgi:dethiobiotin synthetase